MAADLVEFVHTVLSDSDIVRVFPNALVQLFVADTATLVSEVAADADGKWQVATLTTGKYDIKVDGQLIKTINFVRADHTHKANEILTFFHAGAVSADFDSDANHPAYATSQSGVIERIKVVVHSVTNVGNITVHLLKGSVSGLAALTFASNSVWSRQVFPGGSATTYRYFYEATPNISVGANEALAMAIDYTAAGASGVTLEIVFRPN